MDSRPSARETLKRVGLLLVIIGVIDVGFMFYCIATNRNYSSSLNIFAIIGGILLLRGSLSAARVITWFAAFAMTSFLGGIALAPLNHLSDFWVEEWKSNPTEFGVLLPFTLAICVAIIW